MGRREGGRRRRRVDRDDTDGDDDEEYVAEEEEEEEEDEEYREVLSASSAGEEGGGSDTEYDVDEEDEDCETPRPKKLVKSGDRGRKWKRNPAAVRSGRCRYDEDDDYLEEIEEDEEIGDYQEDLEEEEEAPRLKCATKCAGRSQKAKQHGRSNRWRQEEEDMDFEPELDEGEDEIGNYQEDLEEEESPRVKCPTKCAGRRLKAKQHGRSNRRRHEEDDMDFEPELDTGEEDEIGDYQEDLEEEELPQLKGATKSPGHRQKAKLHLENERSNRRRHEKEDDIDFEPGLEEGEEEKDIDFDPDVEDGGDEFEDDEEEVLEISHTRKVRVKNTVRRKPASKQRGGKKNNNCSKVSRRKVSKAAPVRRRRKRSVTDHYKDDEDFIVDDQVEVNLQSRKKPRLGRRIEVDHPESDIETDAWPTVDSDTSDFDFVTSDEEHEDIERVLAEPVRVTVRKGRRKRTFDSGSSSDSEFHVSENESGYIRETGLLDAERIKRTVVSPSSSDSEFHVLDKEVGNSRETHRKRRIFISESSPDSKFHISDKDPGDFRETVHLEAVKKRTFITESSSNSEFHVSNEKLEHFREAGSLEARPTLSASLRRISVKRNGKEKSKEKTEQVDTGKPRCGICLSEDQRMTLQGVLNCCCHYFCFACIMEWSKVESRCPLCKRRFTTITKSSKVDFGMGLKKSIIRVEERDQVYQPTEEEIRRWLDPYENLVCIECNEGGDDSLMLLCDICDSSAHTYCVGLGREVPEGNWYCGGCRLSDEGPSHPGSSVNVNSLELGTTAPIGIFERSPSINPRQTFQGFDLNVSPREILGENHTGQSQASTSGVRLGTLSRRRGWIRTLLDRQRPVNSPDMGLNGVHHSGTEPNHMTIFSLSEANTSQHRGSARRTELNHMNYEGTSENNTPPAVSRYIRMLVNGPRPTICSDTGHNGVHHSGSVSRTEQNHRNSCASSEGNTSQTLLDDIRNQHNFFPLVQAQRNSAPCISVDGNNLQQTEGVSSNIKHMCSISPH